MASGRQGDFHRKGMRIAAGAAGYAERAESNSDYKNDKYLTGVRKILRGRFGGTKPIAVARPATLFMTPYWARSREDQSVHRYVWQNRGEDRYRRETGNFFTTREEAEVSNFVT